MELANFQLNSQNTLTTKNQSTQDTMSQTSGKPEKRSSFPRSSRYSARDPYGDDASVNATRTARDTMRQQPERTSKVTAVRVDSKGGKLDLSQESTAVPLSHNRRSASKKGTFRLPSYHTQDPFKQEAFVEQERGYEGKFPEPQTGAGYTSREDPEPFDDDLCSEDERDVKKLRKERQRRAIRNLKDHNLQRALGMAESEAEYNALLREFDRRCKVSTLARVFGGAPSSSKATRKALDAAGWGR